MKSGTEGRKGGRVVCNGSIPPPSSSSSSPHCFSSPCYRCPKSIRLQAKLFLHAQTRHPEINRLQIDFPYTLRVCTCVYSPIQRDTDFLASASLLVLRVLLLLLLLLLYIRRTLHRLPGKILYRGTGWEMGLTPFSFAPRFVQTLIREMLKLRDM